MTSVMLYHFGSGFILAGFLSQRLQGWVALKRQKPYQSLGAATNLWWRGWLFIARGNPTWYVWNDPWSFRNWHVSNGRILNPRGNFTWATSKADSTNSGRDFLSFVFAWRHRILGWASRQFLTSFTSTPLDSSVVPMTQEIRKWNWQKTMSSSFIVFNECLHESLSSRRMSSRTAIVFNVFIHF